MAGLGTRFSVQGYKIAKPFIEFNGRMMIEHVLAGLVYDKARYILIIRQSFETEYATQLTRIAQTFPVSFITIERVTAGAACTALAAHTKINNQEPVLFADSDTIFDVTLISDMVTDAQARRLDGSLLTFESQDSCYSYAQINEEGEVLATLEKEVISTHAIAGAYYFAQGKDFVDAAIKMLIYADSVKGEYYLSNVFNYIVSAKKKVGIFEVPSSKIHCVGTPQQLEAYLHEYV